MTEFATVDRFCAIEGRQCNKQIPYKGENTFFFAYPGTPMLRDFTSKLVEELRVRGFVGERWEDSVKNDLLFSKVCEGIYSNDFLLAEVTQANANVLLEIGYALAVGRMPVLLQNTNWQPWERRLLISLESCLYETRDDIHQYIANLVSGTSLSLDGPDRQLPYLENMGIFESQEDPLTVLHLKPKLAADWISRVDRTLSRGFFKLSKVDPSDSTYDEFYPQARSIQRSSLVVASLLNGNIVDYEQHNANVSLLIGFAIGLGKRVLVLQDRPIAPILDLGSVSRPIETESQAEQVVKSWIDGQARLSLTQDVESRRSVIRRQRADRLRSIYLGHPDALQDNRLLDYFVPTKEFEDAVEGRRTLFIGRRGSGKSANFQAIRDELRQRPNVVTVEIAPDDFELERISAFIQDDYELINPKMVFQHIWHYVLISEVLKCLEEQTDSLYHSPEDRGRDYLRRYYDEHFEELNIDFGSRVLSALQDVVVQESNISTSERVGRIEESIKELRNYDLGRRLSDFANAEGIIFYMVADDLDKHWRPDTRQSIDLLIGLVSEVDRIQRLFQQRFRPVLFLREDIYDVLSQYDDDLPKRNMLRLEWTRSNLKHLVAERLAFAAGESNVSDDDTWAGIFPDLVDGQSSVDYILSRSLPRPRDVLDFCQKSVDQAQRNGHNHVVAQDIVDGEQEFSSALFWSIESEFRGLYPGLVEILIGFERVPESMPWREFERITNNVIASNQGIIAKWVNGEGIDAQSLADILFAIGLIGLSIRTSEDTYFCNGRNFSETWRLVRPDPVVHIHPAFRKILSVSPASTHSRLRTRRRQEVDPRQLPLDESAR